MSKSIAIAPFLCLLGLVFPFIGFAQDAFVKDALTRLPIPYALVRHGAITLITDANGHFTPQGNVAHCSAFGYEPAEVSIGANDSVVILLQPSHGALHWADAQLARKFTMAVGLKHAAVRPCDVSAHSRVLGYRRMKHPRGREKFLEPLSDSLGDWYYVYASEILSRGWVGSSGPLLETISDHRQGGYKWHGQFAQLVRQFSLNLWDNPIETGTVPFVNPFFSKESDLYSYTLLDTLRDAHGRTLLRVGFAPRGANRDKLLEGEFLADAQSLQTLYVVMRPSLGEDASAQFTIWQRYGSSALGLWQPLEQAMGTNLGLGSLFTKLFSITEFTYAERNGSQQTGAAMAQSLSPRGGQALSERTMRATQDLAQQENISAMAHRVESYFSFRYPLRYVNIPVFSIIDLSTGEGARVGLALETSDRFSSIVQLEGYYAFGTCDKRHKYGGFLRCNFLPRYAMQLQFGYMHDVEMPAGMIWEDKGGRYMLGDYLFNLGAPTLDYRDDYRLTLRGRMWRGVELFLEGAYSSYENRPGMGFMALQPDGSLSPSLEPYSLVSGKVELRWVPLQRLVLYRGGAQVVEERSPLIRLAYTVATEAKQRKRTFHRIESIFSSSAISPLWGSYMLSLRSGITLGDHPLSAGFYNSGAGGSIIGVTFKNVFRTVPVGFAYRDYFVELQTQYDTYPWVGLKLLDSWELSPIVSFNAGWGGVWNRYNWGVQDKPVDMRDGLFEVGLGVAGLMPNSIYPPLRPSLSCFYRLGAYADRDPVKNISIMLSILLGI